MMAGKLRGAADWGLGDGGRNANASRLLETPLGEFSSDTLGTGLSGLSGLRNLAVEVRSQTREAHFTFPRLVR